jgi:hypothetical protein
MSSPPPDPTALREENLRMRRLRHLIALTTAELSQGAHALAEAEAIIERTRRAVLAMFPGKESTFELIYRPRFVRILQERYGSSSGETLQ